MRRMAWLGIALLGLAFVSPATQAQTIAIVAAENFYGDVAQQIGGPNVTVTSILTNPDQDPHLFEASASTARHLAAARIVVLNGADYDPWMAKLLAASKAPQRHVIEVAALVRKKLGDNPHLWYLPATMPAVAQALATELSAQDPAHEADYAERLRAFEASLKPLDDAVATMRGKYAGEPVTATEPVFGYMAEAIGLTMRNQKFQLAVMNDTEPGASDIRAFESDLKTRTVKALIYNNQAREPLTRRMQKLAQEAKVPVVGVSETAPPGKSYQAWMTEQLDALAKALAGQTS